MSNSLNPLFYKVYISEHQFLVFKLAKLWKLNPRVVKTSQTVRVQKVKMFDTILDFCVSKGEKEHERESEDRMSWEWPVGPTRVMRRSWTLTIPKLTRLTVSDQTGTRDRWLDLDGFRTIEDVWRVVHARFRTSQCLPRTPWRHSGLQGVIIFFSTQTRSVNTNAVNTASVFFIRFRFVFQNEEEESGTGEV